MEALSPRVTSEINEKLIADPTMEEIKEALFSIHPDKAPGPDGFPASFFQSNWTMMSSSITSEIQNIFAEGQFPSSLNQTHVRLIPKVTSPKSVAEYRPIALCNVYYKIISKILTKRLQPVLHLLISETLSAFVPGRAISDNVLITHETLHFLKTSGATKHCSMAVKTDMSKAYDRLEWSFIVSVLERLGFHPKCINWIFQCISTVSYSFLINGTAQGEVIPQRGIRQGDPLSPYIFILCGEVLSGLCKNAQIRGTLPRIRVSRGSPRVNHLLFADDTMFFCKANENCCNELRSILSKYEKASGQMINLQKSSITFASKTPHDKRQAVKSCLGIAKEGGQGKYLGLPESFGRSKKDLFSQIVDRIKHKAVGWSTKRLSMAGKLTMIKSVLSAIPTYSMTCFKLLQSLCKRIQSALTRFWWDSNSGKKRMCFVSWRKLAKTKKKGGLGLREINCFNDACLAKLSWRLLTRPESLVAKVILGKYCKFKPLLEVTAPSSCSHGWRSILCGRDLLRSQLGKSLGNGKSTLIWSEAWLSTTTRQVPMGPPTEVTSDLTVSYFLQENSNKWDLEKINTVLPEYSHLIRTLRPSSTNQEDAYIWLPCRDGIYSVKTGYHTAIDRFDEAHPPEEELDIPDFNWNKLIWNAATSPKMKVFLWKIVQQALPLGDNMLRRGVIDNACCTRCGELETSEHLFLHCDFAKKVWRLLPIKTPTETALFSDFITAFKALTNWICLPPTGLGMGSLFSWLCWSLWSARNFLVFENRSFSPEETVLKAIKDAREWQNAQLDHKLLTSSTTQSVPTTPATPVDQDVITVFTDASWKSPNVAGLGMVFFDSQPYELWRSNSTDSHVSSPLMEEALAILAALEKALATGYTKIIIKSDAKDLLRIITNKEPNSELHGILADIHHLCHLLSFISFCFIPRRENSLADELAKNALLPSSSTLVSVVSDLYPAL